MKLSFKEVFGQIRFTPAESLKNEEMIDNLYIKFRHGYFPFVDDSFEPRTPTEQ